MLREFIAPPSLEPFFRDDSTLWFVLNAQKSHFQLELVCSNIPEQTSFSYSVENVQEALFACETKQPKNKIR
jgi:hypothetical protein